MWLRYQNKIDFEIEDEDTEDEDSELDEDDEYEEDDSPETEESEPWNDSDGESVIKERPKRTPPLVKEKCTLLAQKMNLLRRKSEFLIPV